MVPEALRAGTGSVSVLKMLFSLEIITNVNYILDPSGVCLSSRCISEQENCQQLFLIDVSLVKLMHLSVYSVSVCFGGSISSSIRPCFSDF